MERLRSNGPLEPFYDTGDVARLFGWKHHKVICAVDRGDIESHRIPGEKKPKYRRMRASHVREFAERHNMDCTVPAAREILVVTREDIRDALKALLAEALDDVTVYHASPDEAEEIARLKQTSPTLVSYTIGESTVRMTNHERRLPTAEKFLAVLAHDTLLRSDVYESNLKTMDARTA